MSNPNRRDFLKFGVALPVAMHTLASRACDNQITDPPRRIIFICNSLGFYAPNFFPAERGNLETSEYLKGLTTKDKLTVFQNLFHSRNTNWS